jgi:putative transcriptional regulator
MEEISFENRLRVARVERGLSQAQLADLAGVTRQTIGLIEAGRYNPTIKLCLILARETGRTLDQLFWIKEER